MSLISPIAIAVVALFVPISTQQTHEHGGPEKLGTVRFSTSCTAAAQPALVQFRLSA